jgi:hypothetical protein
MPRMAALYRPAPLPSKKLFSKTEKVLASIRPGSSLITCLAMRAEFDERSH